MDTAKEIVSLIKSPGENLEGPESEAKGILGLCTTRWTGVSTHKLFSANPRQLGSSSSGVDNFP